MHFTDFNNYRSAWKIACTLANDLRTVQAKKTTGQNIMKVINAKNQAIVKNVNAKNVNEKKDGKNRTRKAADVVVGGVKKKLAAVKAKAEKLFTMAVQAYRVWKRLDVASYKGQGQGTIANQRKVALRLMTERGSGQFCILHKSELGYAFTHGKRIDDLTVQAGLMQIRFDKAQIVKTFNTFKALVQYVQKHGEKNVQGTETWQTLSNGGRYSLYTNGKTVIRLEGSGKASGSYADYQKDGKHYGKFGSVKVG